MSSSSANGRELDSVPPGNINTELALWKHLIFTSDMAPPQEKRHDDPAQDHTIPPPYFQAPLTVPPQLPPETYTYLIHALLSLQGSTHPHNYPPSSPYSPISNYDYPWSPGTVPPVSFPSIAGPSSFYPTNAPIPPPRPAQQSTSSSQPTPSPAASSMTASTAQDPEGTEDAVSTVEDKRRRNTAASARFRTKKKLKTLNLERTVADLTGRTEELEREANDLRRENAWLKEIVLLKGRNLSTLNLGSRASGPSNQHGDDEEDRTQAGSELGSTAKGGGKGKDKEN